jgi:outer membrane lipoprotein-sorting protein
MRIFFCVLALAAGLSAALSPALLPGANRPTDSSEAAARALIQEQARAVQSLHEFEVSHQVDVSSLTPKFRQTTHQYLDTWVKRPHLIRVEVKAMMHSETLVSDGLSTWIYRDADGLYWRQSGAAPAALFLNAFPGLSRELSDVNLPSIMTAARITGVETLPVGAQSFLCDVVDVSLSPAATHGAIQNNSIRMWISRQYHVPLKVQATFLGQNGTGNKTYSDYVTTFLPDTQIPQSTWVFLPPKGSKPAHDTKAPGLD